MLRMALLGVLLPTLCCAGSPQIWFAPLDDVTRAGAVAQGVIPAAGTGSTDYMSLFAAGAPWTQAAAQVSIFKFYTQPISGNQYGQFTDGQLQQIFSFLKQHNIAIALEFSTLIAAQGCGFINGPSDPLEGFEGNTSPAQNIVNRFKANGGTLSYLVMDEPFYYANLYSGPGACNWSAQQIATNALTNLNILKAGFPGLIIGDEEPMSGNGLAADLHLQQVPPVPHRNGSLTLAVTHRFPRRGKLQAA
jgi:hypothetical protein